MKKILATLLVATMIMSCMTLVSFAAVGDGTTEFYTIANAPGADFTEAMTEHYTYWECNLPETFAPGDDVLFPILFKDNTGVAAFQYKIEYDPEVIQVHPEYAVLDNSSFAGKWTGVNTGILGEIHANFTIADNNVSKTFGNLPVIGSGKNVEIAPTGNVQIINFQIKEDAPENATTDIKFTIVAYKAYESQTAQGQTDYTATVNVSCDTMTVKIGNGGTVVEKDPATAEDISDVTAFTGDSDDYDAAFAAIENIESGDGVAYEYAKYGVYQVYFATAVADTFKTPDEQGIQFTINDNEPVYKAAKKIVDGKFGILIFGMGTQSTVEAKAYAKYDTEYVLAD